MEAKTDELDPSDRVKVMFAWAEGQGDFELSRAEAKRVGEGMVRASESENPTVIEVLGPGRWVPTGNRPVSLVSLRETMRTAALHGPVHPHVVSAWVRHLGRVVDGLDPEGDENPEERERVALAALRNVWEAVEAAGFQVHYDARHEEHGQLLREYVGLLGPEETEENS